MKRPAKIFLALLGAGVLVLGLVLVIFVATFDPNEYKDEIVRAVEAQTGRELVMRGDVELAASLFPTVVINDVTLANAAWSERPVMLSVDRLEVQAAALPLLRGAIVIHRIVLQKPEIYLEIHADGRANWEFEHPARPTKTAESAPASTGAPAIAINAVQIESGRIHYHRPDAEPMLLSVDKLLARSEAIDAPLQLELQANYADLPINVSGSVGSLEQLTRADSYRLDLAINLGKAGFTLKGESRNPAHIEGFSVALTAGLPRLDYFNELTGTEFPAVEPLSLNAQLSGNAEQLQISDLKLQFAESDLAGDASLTLTGERPAIKATLVSDTLDIRSFQPADEDSDTAGAAKAERLFSSEQFDLTALRKIDADINLNAARLQTRQAEIMPFELKLKLAAGRLQITPSGHLASGQLAADVHLDVAAATPALKLDLVVDDILPEQLPALAEKPFMRNGRTDIRFNGASRGTSPAALAGNFTGQLLVKVGNGELLSRMTDLAGADLIFSAFQMLNPMAEEDSSSTLVCGVLNFAIEDGLATAKEGIALQTNKVNVLGSAIINLKTEEIDFRAKPRARSGMGVNIGQLTDAVYIGGTLMNPRPTTDVRGALKTAGRVGAAFATGGLSVLAQGMFDRKFSSDDPCGVALGKIATTDGSPPPEPVEEKGTLEQAGDGVRGMFRGIFGGDK